MSKAMEERQVIPPKDPVRAKFPHNFWLVTDGKDGDGIAFCYSAATATELQLAPELVEALRLIDAGFRLAEKSTPANLRRCILAARPLLAKAGE